MSSKKKLGIEKGLKEAGDAFFEKYSLMRDRLLNNEYEHWAAGFPEGNNHGRGHITRVLQNLDNLLGKNPLACLTPYELFLAMMSILYHDIGLLRKRKGHEEISKSLLEGDTNDAYVMNPIDKEIIAAAVVSHSSSKDIAQECARFSPQEPIGKYTARPRVVAALVRLADELDEDYRRADPIVQSRLALPAESRFFWLFCQRVRGVRPDLVAKRIDFNLAFEKEDTVTYGPVPGGAIRHFVAFCAEKLAKINQERVYVNRFLPPELQYGGLHVDLKPLRNHPTWKEPRTFVFNDSTPYNMFLRSLPELLDEPARKTIQGALELMRKRELDAAAKALDELASVKQDLPVDVQMNILYERACIQSMKAEDHAGEAGQRDAALESGAKYLMEWYGEGRNRGWDAIGRTELAEVHRMANDGDLAFLLRERRNELQKVIPRSAWPQKRGGGGGCIQAGTHVDTPHGARRVEDLRPGDIISSLRLGGKPEFVQARVGAVATSRTTTCIRLNYSLAVTPKQQICTDTGWVRAEALTEGDRIVDRNGQLAELSAVSYVEGYFEIFDLTVDDPCHSYFAEGFLCHNKVPASD